MAYVGMAIAFILLAKPVAIAARRTNSFTIPDLLCARFGDSKPVRALSAPYHAGGQP
jgi:sodium/proline symporter